MKIKTRLGTIALVFLTFSHGIAANDDRGMSAADGSPESFDALEQAIDSLFGQGDLAGFSACLIRSGQLAWSGVRGEANLEENLPVLKDTLFQVGSLSKTMTGTVLMHLYDRGLLGLDEDINRYLPFRIENPGFPSEPITVRMLLTHTSSILDNNDYISELYGCGDQTEVPFRAYLENAYTPEGSRYTPSNFAEYGPGQGWAYANSNFVLAAYLVEVVSGEPFSEYSKTHLFEPLEMEHTSWLFSETEMEKLARQYVAESEARKYPDHPRIDKTSTRGKTGVCHYSWPGFPDGGLKTNTREFSNFMLMLMNGGRYKNRRVLGQETVEQILSPQHVDGMFTSSRWDNIDQGLAWQLRESGQEYYFSHGGSGSGISTFAFFDPGKKSGSVFFMTGDWHDKAYDREFFDVFRKYLVDAEKQ